MKKTTKILAALHALILASLSFMACPNNPAGTQEVPTIKITGVYGDREGEELSIYLSTRNFSSDPTTYDIYEEGKAEKLTTVTLKPYSKHIYFEKNEIFREGTHKFYVMAGDVKSDTYTLVIKGKREVSIAFPTGAGPYFMGDDITLEVTFTNYEETPSRVYLNWTDEDADSFGADTVESNGKITVTFNSETASSKVKLGENKIRIAYDGEDLNSKGSNKLTVTILPKVYIVAEDDHVHVGDNLDLSLFVNNYEGLYIEKINVYKHNGNIVAEEVSVQDGTISFTIPENFEPGEYTFYVRDYLTKGRDDEMGKSNEITVSVYPKFYIHLEDPEENTFKRDGQIELCVDLAKSLGNPTSVKIGPRLWSGGKDISQQVANANTGATYYDSASTECEITGGKISFGLFNENADCGDWYFYAQITVDEEPVYSNDVLVKVVPADSTEPQINISIEETEVASGSVIHIKPEFKNFEQTPEAVSVFFCTTYWSQLGAATPERYKQFLSPMGSEDPTEGVTIAADGTVSSRTSYIWYYEPSTDTYKKYALPDDAPESAEEYTITADTKKNGLYPIFVMAKTTVDGEEKIIFSNFVYVKLIHYNKYI